MKAKKKFLGFAVIPIILLAVTSILTVNGIFFTYYNFYNPESWAKLHWEATPFYNTNWGYYVFYRIVTMIAISLVSVYLFFNGFERQKYYPKFYIFFQLITLIVFAVELGFSLTLPINGIMEYFDIYGKIIFQSFVTLIFVPYFIFSKTVKEIFIH